VAVQSSTSAADVWSDHRLRQVKTTARFVASILEAPYHALLDDKKGELFISDVAHLNEWLAPCEQWSMDQKVRPADISPSILDALFSLWSIFSRLGLLREQKEADYSRMALHLEVFCSLPLRKQFKAAVERLSELMDQRDAVPSQPVKEAELEAASPRLVIEPDSKTATLDGVIYASLQPDGILILQALLEADGRVMTGDDLRSLPGLKGKRIDRCYRRLPPALQQIVRTETGKGYWIELPGLPHEWWTPS
jgi:hypothetical protein